MERKGVIDNNKHFHFIRADMGGKSIFVLFLVSVLILRAEARVGKQEDKKKQAIATIHVINATPNGSQPMLVRCSSRFTDHGMQGVQVGEDYQSAQRWESQGCFLAGQVPRVLP
ncbi:hypothetical protein COLO4_34094 [Corchorus olitorius]|uniref:Uncharacterized protein n=1 Tax=Corchorus olitorius TaxID=93759 RepID=A0A1R3GNQ3_9ROSI|nr:hypothetical protein COLO4_34094 [Corchorus olitorius]